MGLEEIKTEWDLANYGACHAPWSNRAAVDMKFSCIKCGGDMRKPIMEQIRARGR